MPCLALYLQYTAVCNTDSRQIFQTWENTKNGSLTEIGVNVARNIQNSSLTINVFRYQNNSNFFTPGYKWDLLATQTFPSANLSWVFGVASIQVNSTPVAVGDRLGFQIVAGLNRYFQGQDFAPFCHLETALDETFDIETSTRTVFAQGIGQNSYRGANGTVAPVYVEPGTEVKFYSIVM